MDGRWLDRVGALVAITVIAVYAFTVIAPYFLGQSSPELVQLIDRNKGTVDTVTVAVVMFFFGASVGRSKDADSINALVRQANTQSGALVIPQGEQAAVTNTPAGTVIEKAGDDERA